MEAEEQARQTDATEDPVPGEPEFCDPENDTGHQDRVAPPHTPQARRKRSTRKGTQNADRQKSTPRRANHVALLHSQRQLAVVWFAACAPSFILLVALHLAGTYQEKIGDVWRWYAPNVLPTLGLIVNVIREDRPINLTTSRFVLRLTTVLSVSYGLLLLATVLSTGLSKNYTIPVRIDAMRSADLFLALMQSLTAGLMSSIFLKQDIARAEPANAAQTQDATP